MDDLIKVFPYLAQVPIVLLVLYLNSQHKKDQLDQQSQHAKEQADLRAVHTSEQTAQRERFLDYMRERDAGFLAALSEHSKTNGAVSSEIKALAIAITRLDTILMKGRAEPRKG